MDRTTNNLVVAIIRPPLVALRFLFRELHHIFFAWWLDKRLVRKNNERLQKEIETDMQFLFVRQGGRFIPNDVDPPASFDFAAVTVAVDQILFRFTSGRGSLGVHISRQRTPHEWHELSAVLSLVTHDFERKPFLFWSDVEKVLRVHLSSIEQAFSEEHYGWLTEKSSAIRQHDRAAMRQSEAEINRILY